MKKPHLLLVPNTSSSIRPSFHKVHLHYKSLLSVIVWCMAMWLLKVGVVRICLAVCIVALQQLRVCIQQHCYSSGTGINVLGILY